MRFILSIELGNAEMFTANHIAFALRRTASKLVQGGHDAVPQVDNAGPIHDDNGNRVGSWHVEGDHK